MGLLYLHRGGYVYAVVCLLFGWFVSWTAGKLQEGFPQNLEVGWFSTHNGQEPI